MSDYSRICIVTGAAGAFLLALLGLLSYLPDLRVLGSFHPDYIPMAPSTAVSFILLSIGVLALSRPFFGKFGVTTFQLFAGLTALFGLLEVLGHLTGYDLNFEETLVPEFGYLDNIPLARMSPATGFLFFSVGMGLVVLLQGWRQPEVRSRCFSWGGVLAVVTVFGATVFFLGYLFEKPFLYGNEGTVPMALSTALGFMFLGGAILGGVGKELLRFNFFARSNRTEKPMSARKRFVVLIVVMVGACALVLLIMTIMLYRHQILEHGAILRGTAKGQARLIEAIAREQIKVRSDNSTKRRNGEISPDEALLKVLNDYAKYREYDASSEIVLARREEDKMIFLSWGNAEGDHSEMVIALDETRATPMQQALQGRSGVMSGIDYRGERVLAAYEPVSVFALGVVAKIRLQEVYTPFIYSGLLATVIAILVIWGGAGLFFHVGTPIVKRLEEYAHELEEEIEARKYAEFSLNRINRLLRVKNNELEQMLSVASHDLRSPLVNISGFSAALEPLFAEIEAICARNRFDEQDATRLDYLLQRRVPEALRFIKAGTVKMEALIAGLLKLSRLNRAELTLEKIDMNALLQQVVAENTFMAESVDAQIDIEELPSCYGDADLVNHVFTNLLLNAFKYADPGRTIKVRIDGRLDGDRAIYCVADNGIGIAPEHQENIFKLFHRLDPDVTEGEGLGLSIVRRALDSLAGDIWVESKSGKGSRFFVMLPAEEDAAPERR